MPFRDILRLITLKNIGRAFVYITVYPFIKLKFYFIQKKVNKTGDISSILKLLVKSAVKGRPILPL